MPKRLLALGQVAAFIDPVCSGTAGLLRNVDIPNQPGEGPNSHLHYRRGVTEHVDKRSGLQGLGHQISAGGADVGYEVTLIKPLIYKNIMRDKRALCLSFRFVLESLRTFPLETGLTPIVGCKRFDKVQERIALDLATRQPDIRIGNRQRRLGFLAQFAQHFSPELVECLVAGNGLFCCTFHSVHFAQCRNIANSGDLGISCIDLDLFNVYLWSFYFFHNLYLDWF